MRYFQADVFAPQPFTGNGVGVFPEATGLSPAQMQVLTQELRQFECVFLTPAGGGAVGARIFTVEEELPFAGHPLLGAGAVLHQLADDEAERSWALELVGARRLELRSRREAKGFVVEMDQGVASFGPPLDDDAVLAALALDRGDLAAGLPLQVVSTGLPYLLVPLQGGLDRAHIRHPDFETLLARHGAKFVYLLDVAGGEGRTWDNRGAVEDVATGSAAGPAGAYCVRHGKAPSDHWQRLTQGRFAGRPSELEVHIARSGDVTVRGAVHLVAEGRLLARPAR